MKKKVSYATYYYHYQAIFNHLALIDINIDKSYYIYDVSYWHDPQGYLGYRLIITLYDNIQDSK